MIDPNIVDQEASLRDFALALFPENFMALLYCWRIAENGPDDAPIESIPVNEQFSSIKEFVVDVEELEKKAVAMVTEETADARARLLDVRRNFAPEVIQRQKKEWIHEVKLNAAERAKDFNTELSLKFCEMVRGGLFIVSGRKKPIDLEKPRFIFPPDVYAETILDVYRNEAVVGESKYTSILLRLNGSDQSKLPDTDDETEMPARRGRRIGHGAIDDSAWHEKMKTDIEKKNVTVYSASLEYMDKAEKKSDKTTDESVRKRLERGFVKKYPELGK